MKKKVKSHGLTQGVLSIGMTEGMSLGRSAKAGRQGYFLALLKSTTFALATYIHP